MSEYEDLNFVIHRHGMIAQRFKHVRFVPGGHFGFGMELLQQTSQGQDDQHIGFQICIVVSCCMV